MDNLYKSINPYKEETPTQLLQRVVQLPDLTWTTGSGIITVIRPLRAIITNSPIHQQVLGLKAATLGSTAGMYRYLRCGFKLIIRVNSTQFHQGTIMVNWLPKQAGGTSLYSTVVANSASIHNTVILSASKQDSATIHIPFMGTYPHHDLAGVQTKIQDVYVFIRVLNPLLTSSAAVVDSIPITVFLQMEDIELYGYLPTVAMTAFTGERPFKEQSSQQAKTTTNSEAQAKDNQGQSAPGPLNIIKPIIRSIPIVGDAIDLVKGLVANLDKPSTDQVTTFTMPRYHRGHTLLTGADYCEPLTSFPSYQVTKQFSIHNSDMKVTDYAQMPALFYTTTCTTKGVILTLNVHPMVYGSSTRTEPDFLAFATSFFTYWRGGIKFLIQFVGTPFYSARFRISVSHTLVAPSGGAGDGTGYTSRIVDAKGDAWTEFTVPYLTPQIWSMTNQTKNGPAQSYLIIELLTDVQGSSLPATALYYVNIWRGAASDYQLSQLRPGQDLTPLPENRPFKEQSSLVDVWKGPADAVQTQATGSQESGICMADQSSTITDMCKRFVPHTFPTTGAPYSYPWYDYSVPLRDPFHTWAQSFVFWRGSRRLKLSDSEFFTIVPPGGTYADGVASRDGGAIALDSSSSTQSATVPWHCQFIAAVSDIRLYQDADTIPALPIDGICSTTGLPYWIAGGDDFMYLWPLPPIWAALQPAPVSKVSTNTSRKAVTEGDRSIQLNPSRSEHIGESHHTNARKQ